MTEMLFHVFEWKALRCPKDMSVLDDLVHDFVYCLRLSLVLKVLRLFPWLLRFPRREKPHGYWILHYLQRAREAKRSWGERQSPTPWLLQVALSQHWLSREGRRKGTGAAPGCPRRACRACHVFSCLATSPIYRVGFGSDSRLAIRPTFLASHSKTSCKFKHMTCLNWLFHSW